MRCRPCLWLLGHLSRSRRGWQHTLLLWTACCCMACPCCSHLLPAQVGAAAAAVLGVPVQRQQELQRTQRQQVLGLRINRLKLWV